jgi:ABC-2 type transport system ATP-binding protein
MTAMIDVRHLRKEYGSNVAIENLTLQIPPGEVFGLIGPNGAGKTTLIRILATLLEPTYGDVYVDGVDALADPLAVHPRIGYMSDFFALYENMKVWAYLDHFARCYGIEASRREKLIDEALLLVDLNVRKDAEVKALSRGMRQRLCFAKTLLHEPKVLLLDEPASGLDPRARIEFRELIKRLHEMGRTVLISSHILQEMSDFCTSIGIFEKGKLLAAGRVEEIIRKLHAGLQIEIEVVDGRDRLLELLSNHEGAANAAPTTQGARCHWTLGRDQLPTLHRAIVASEISVVAFAVRDDDLEDVYLRISTHQTA